jgi:hypothetical protein
MREHTVRNGFFILLVALTTLAFFGLIRAFLLPADPVSAGPAGAAGGGGTTGPVEAPA